MREMVKGKRCDVINLMILYYEFLLNCLIHDNGAGHLNVSVDDLLSFLVECTGETLQGKEVFLHVSLHSFTCLMGACFFIYCV